MILVRDKNRLFAIKMNVLCVMLYVPASDLKKDFSIIQWTTIDENQMYFRMERKVQNVSQLLDGT